MFCSCLRGCHIIRFSLTLISRILPTRGLWLPLERVFIAFRLLKPLGLSTLFTIAGILHIFLRYERQLFHWFISMEPPVASLDPILNFSMSWFILSAGDLREDVLGVLGLVPAWVTKGGDTWNEVGDKSTGGFWGSLRPPARSWFLSQYWPSFISSSQV